MQEDDVVLGVEVYLGLMLLILLLFSIFIVYYFAEHGFPWHSYITLSIGYFASFAILLLVPIDIASVIISRQSKHNSESTQELYDRCVAILNIAYNTFFTIIFFFGSFILVFEEYYNTDGK
jgi:hypothetical protein